jgi:hypothetical protein
MATPGLEIYLSVVYDRQNRSFKEIQRNIITIKERSYPGTFHLVFY